MASQFHLCFSHQIWWKYFFKRAICWQLKIQICWIDRTWIGYCTSYDFHNLITPFSFINTCFPFNSNLTIVWIFTYLILVTTVTTCGGVLFSSLCTFLPENTQILAIFAANLRNYGHTLQVQLMWWRTKIYKYEVRMIKPKLRS